MEHLHHGPKTVDLQFPYLSETNFDFDGEWLQYPNHEGIDLEKIRYFEWRKFPPVKLAQVLQNWLFFGLLRAIIPREISIQTEDFIRIGEDGQRFISTARLPEYLAKWMKLKGSLSEEDKQLVDRRNRLILDEAQPLTYALSGLPSQDTLVFHLFLPVPLEIALSCALLGEALALTNAALVDRNLGQIWSLGDTFCERLEIDGWCPFTISSMHQFSRLCTLHFCATLGGPKVKLSHRKCTDKLCIHTLNITARHFLQGCVCSMLKPEIEEVVSVIRRNQTPTLRYRKGGDYGALEIEAANNSTAYTAISHVWSDGLGNTKGNQMNQCQLARVQKAVDRLYQEDLADNVDCRWWWLDTLCVPKGETYKKEESDTISRMKEIYTRADKVLVIDSGLSTCDESTHVLEILARFRLSNWIRRLWTIQEGLFAREIFLLVGAVPISLCSLVSEAKRLPRDGFQNIIGLDLISNFGAIFGPSISNEVDCTSIERFEATTFELRVAEVIQTMVYRTSTFLRDEPLCLALLLDMDTTLIFHEIEKEKQEKGAHMSKSDTTSLSPATGPSVAGMTKFIQLANDASQRLNPPGCIPPSIISIQAKRLNKPGFRWAPESILNSEGNLLRLPSVIPSPDDPDAQIIRPSGMLCANGLKVMFPGILISEIHGGKPLHHGFLVDTSTDQKRKAYMPTFWKAAYSKSKYDPQWESKGDETGIAPTEKDSNQLAIIICAYGDLNVRGQTSVLVRIKDTGPDGELIVERMCTLAGERTPFYDDQEWITEPWKRVKGRWLPITQMWCVD